MIDAKSFLRRLCLLGNRKDPADNKPSVEAESYDGLVYARLPERAKIITQSTDCLESFRKVECLCGHHLLIRTNVFDLLVTRSGPEPLIQCHCGRRIGTASLLIVEDQPNG